MDIIDAIKTAHEIEDEIWFSRNILEQISRLAAPENASNQLVPLMEASISNSLSQGRMNELEAANCKFIINNCIEAFLRPYKLGFKAGVIVGKRKAVEEDAFRNEFADMMGFEWDTKEGYWKNGTI